MKSYKVVASDLDGTLLNNESKISGENLKAIKKLAGLGVYFVPSTGRTFSEIPEELRNNPDIRYVIHSNGAVVLDKETGNRIANCIPGSLCCEILDILNAYETHIAFRCDGQCFVDARFQTDELFDYYNLIEAHRVVIRDYAVHLDDFEKVCRELDNVEVFSAFFRNMEDKLVCKSLFEKMEGLRVVEVSEHNLEVVNVNAGKGNALHSLADLLGVSHSDTISIGDSDNDTSITQAAGLGLAVSNACDSLKEIAGEIICSNEEHAVVYVLSHYFS